MMVPKGSYQNDVNDENEDEKQDPSARKLFSPSRYQTICERRFLFTIQDEILLVEYRIRHC